MIRTGAGDDFLDSGASIPLEVLGVIGALAVCALLWASTLWVRTSQQTTRSTDLAERRERRRAVAAGVAALVLVVGCLGTDFPFSSGATFWAEHALLTGVMTTCALLGLGYVFVDRQEKKMQERRERELLEQERAITQEMCVSVASDITFALLVLSGTSGQTLDRARDRVLLQQEIVGDALVEARSWFVALSGGQYETATRGLAMLADYMSHLRGAEYEIRIFKLDAANASAMTNQLGKECKAVDRSLERAEAVVMRYLQDRGIDRERLMEEELARRNPLQRSGVAGQ